MIFLGGFVAKFLVPDSNNHSINFALLIISLILGMLSLFFAAHGCPTIGVIIQILSTVCAYFAFQERLNKLYPILKEMLGSLIERFS